MKIEVSDPRSSGTEIGSLFPVPVYEIVATNVSGFVYTRQYKNRNDT